MNRNLALALSVLVLAVLACCCCSNPAQYFDWAVTFEPYLTPQAGFPPADTPTPEPPPVVTREPLPDIADETEQLLQQAVVPGADMFELAVRLQGLDPDTPRVSGTTNPDYPLGTQRVFHASDSDTDEQFEVTAVLVYKTEHVYMWVEEGVHIDPDDIAAAAETFEKHTYPTNRAFFGSEPFPGVDGDPHLSILHARGLGDTVAGYFSSPDGMVRAVRPDSNEMEMFYINADNADVNSDFYNGTLAHEFQHMIHRHNDSNEEIWLNEGFSELASALNGYDPGGSEWWFAGQPDTQLNSWPEGTAGDATANYGASYLFTSYFLDRFGEQATRDLVAHAENGMESVDLVLSDLGQDSDHVDLFADWVVANFLDDPDLEQGRYGYRRIDPPQFSADAEYDSQDLPVQNTTAVHQYATDYVELRGNTSITFDFTGSTAISLMDNRAHSGSYLFWSNRVDQSDTTLTRAFDLTGASAATLNYWTWYHIEEDWDYAYVEVSTDGGQTWELLQAPSSTLSNPNDNSYGWGYTGVSGSGGMPEWIQESVSLDAYAGQQVLVRFEYITDMAVTQSGFAVDDISIPELDYSEDFEGGDGGWEAAGFVRHANVLPQRWLVQLMLFGPQTTVQRLELQADQSGQWTIPLDGRTDRAVVAISAYAPVTTLPASYSYHAARD